MGKLTVLIVDDSLITQKKIAVILNGLGHEVIGMASSGSDALEKYRSLKPDLVTMDITMPDMDGVTATRTMIEEFPSASVVMVTSHGQERMVMDALDAGAKGYILKPFSADKLRETIDQLFAEKAAP